MFNPSPIEMAEKRFHALISGIASRHTSVAELQFIRDDSAGFTVTSLSGGSCNHVLKLTSADGAHSLLFKHAAERVKNFSEYSIPTIRVDLDYYSLEKFAEACPAATPELYCLDTETHTAVMEYLDGTETLSEQLSRGHIDVDVARRIGEITASFHKHTWCSLLPDGDRDKMIELYNVERIVTAKRNLSFDEAIDEDSIFNTVEEENLSVFQELKADRFLEEHIKQLRDYHFGCRQCLVHNDYYSSSIMIQNGVVKVIDMEFANVGVGAYDTGMMVSFYVLTYYKARMEGHRELADQALQATRTMIDAYVTSMSTDMMEDCEQKKLVEDITDFIGHSLIRSSIFTDIGMHLHLNPAVKVTCWKYGKKMMQKATEVTNIDDCITLICGDVS